MGEGDPKSGADGITLTLTVTLTLTLTEEVDGPTVRELPLTLTLTLMTLTLTPTLAEVDGPTVREVPTKSNDNVDSDQRSNKGPLSGKLILNVLKWEIDSVRKISVRKYTRHTTSSI